MGEGQIELHIERQFYLEATEGGCGLRPGAQLSDPG